MRAGGLLLWWAWPASRRSQGLQLEEFSIQKATLNGLQYHDGIQQHFKYWCLYTRVATRSYLASRLVNNLEHFDNQRPFDSMRPARLALVRLSV